jgi:DtxR family transcriptional regulator, Mn-dependent transcriptional regulator
MQSPSEENYLKAIYLLGRQSTLKVSITVLAAELGNNPASIIDMLKKLSEKKLVEYNKSEGAKLTSSGEEKALLMVRKHRLWEMFLQDKLGYTWDEVHDIAEQLEHVKDKNLADRLDNFLGFPQFDPHGEPIPASDGKVPDFIQKTLNNAEIGKDVKVVSVKDTSKSFLQHLYKLNIGIGTTVKVLEKIEFDGSLIILIGLTSRETISEKFAESIFIN